MIIRKNSRIAPGRRRSWTSKAAIPVLAVAGGGLALGSAAALELGEIQVQSTLGQPLRASIAYALSPDEIIDARCIAVRSGGPELPGLRDASVRVSKGVISITGASPVLEPMLSANIVVECPYSAQLSRNYLMFIDPHDRPAAPARLAGNVAASAAPSVTTVASRPRRAPAASPVAQESRYRVQTGDSLSAIVRRIENPGVADDVAMAAIIDTNPNAFVNGDPDKLKAGSWLNIPSFARDVVTHAAPTLAQEPAAPATEAPAATDLYQGAETLEPDARKQMPATEFLPEVPEPAAVDLAETAAETTEMVTDQPDSPDTEADYSAAYAGLVAGDVVIDEPAAAAATPGEPAAAPARVVSPSAGTRIVGMPEPAGFGGNWLIWAAIAVISAFGAYLMFWPRLRERFGSRPVGPEEKLPPRQERVAPISVPESEMTVHEITPAYENVDFDLSDDSPTEENLALDADLVDGTGLDDAGDVDVNRDFGFAATMDLDMELPETAAMEDSAPETDIIPPPERPEDLVVDSEVLPEDEEEDEYDISMVVDATKMPDPAEVTERDLRAVPVDDTAQTRINDDYTIVDEIGQDILEQDYEDEMSATQLLNAEIEKAASELAQTIGDDDYTEVASLDDDNAGKIVGAEDDTSIEMQLTNLSNLDLTASLEAQNDEVGDELDVTARIEADDKTVEMPRDKDGARAH